MSKENRRKLEIKPEDRKTFFEKALRWADTHSRFAYFNSNNYEFPQGCFNHFLAVGTYQVFNYSGKDDFDSLAQNIESFPDYWIGHLTYDLKNQLDNLESTNEVFIDFKPMLFFVPETVIHFDSTYIIETYDDPNRLYKEILNTTLPVIDKRNARPTFKSKIDKRAYLETVQKLRDHIVEGDIYEINYCHQYTSEEIDIDPIQTYLNLNNKVPSPFSTLYKDDDNYLISASPERFIKKNSATIISQPIKGTAPRNTDPTLDAKNRSNLKESEKERAENMMIVDLVRNDLARSCKSGSVKVDEMFGVYSFPLWHQMISTVTAELKDDTTSVDCIKNAFPMGSMTGAPKIKVMELIDEYEVFQRNIYSGSIGYFLPNGDFDFNVVIRSLAYNSRLKKSSFSVGGAITYDSDAEEEYNECLLKAKTFQSIFDIKY